MDRFARVQLFGGVEIGVPRRQRPARTWRDSDTTAVGIDPAKIEIGAGRVGLAAVERGCLDLEGATEDPRGQRPIRRVRRVLPMVAQGRERIALRGGTVLERRRTDCRLAHRRGVQRRREIRRQGALPQGRQLDPEIVGMLAIDEGHAFVALSRLQQQRVPSSAHRPRIGARHDAQRDLAAAERPGCREHAPIDHVELIVAARAALFVVQRRDDAVHHQGPLTSHEVCCMHR